MILISWVAMRALPDFIANMRLACLKLRTVGNKVAQICWTSILHIFVICQESSDIPKPMELRKEAVSVAVAAAKASEDFSLSSSSKGKSKQENITSSDVDTEDTLCSSEYQFTTLENSELTEKESCSDAQTQIETKEPNTPVDKNEMVREKNKEETTNAEDERPTDGPQTLISSPVVSPMRGNITSLRFEICVQKSEF